MSEKLISDVCILKICLRSKFEYPTKKKFLRKGFAPAQFLTRLAFQGSILSMMCRITKRSYNYEGAAQGNKQRNLVKYINVNKYLYRAKVDNKVHREHKLNRYADEYVDIVLLYPALVVYSQTSKCIQIFLLTVYGG